MSGFCLTALVGWQCSYARGKSQMLWLLLRYSVVDLSVALTSRMSSLLLFPFYDECEHSSPIVTES